jgi:uncharacterized protein YqgC (DUF456 family)
MVDPFLAASLALLLAGIIGSIVPGLPGPVFSIGGALLYWWSTGYTTPGTIAMVLIVSTGLLAIFLDVIAGYLGAKRSSDRKTGVLAALSAVACFIVTGPIGVILGPGLVVFLVETSKGVEPREALDTALKTTLALMGSVVGKVVLTSLILATFLVSVLL